MNVSWLCLGLCLLPSLALCRQVTLDTGRLEGVRQHTSHQGSPVVSFLGVHYGQAPVGDRRFQLARPSEAWTGVRLADSDVKCPQLDSFSGSMVGVEDCLVLNVHLTEEMMDAETPDTPVLVFIHGGGFVFGDGTSEIYGPEWILDFGVILVTINYRLGALGFLSTGDQVCSLLFCSFSSFIVHLILLSLLLRLLFLPKVFLYLPLGVTSQPGSVGPETCSDMGPAQHCTVWRRSSQVSSSQF